MAATLVQFCGGTISRADECVARIAELTGLKVSRATELSHALTELREVSHGSNGPAVVAVSGLVMAQLCSLREPSKQVLFQELRALANFFIYGFPEESGADLMRHWHGLIGKQSLASLAPGVMTYEFEEAARSPLANLSFTSKTPQPVMVFSNHDRGDNARILLTVNAQPVLVACRHGRAEDYLLSQAPAITVDTAVVPPRIPYDYQGEILPTALALKQMFGQFCWHNPFPVACLVIDDPWLRPRYGYFNFDQVLAELKAKNYTTTVAFIPSNYRRNDPRVVSQVAGHADQLSLCIHGCDHTGGEFGETNEKSVESKAAIAMDNMRKLQNRTGLSFDSVMVFPQGVYSSCSLPALKHCGYLAAVNTVPYPTDHLNAPVTLADIYDLAITRYDSFPLFTRHYPKGLFDFAVALFWGKPVLLVEHHEYYQKGLALVTEFAEQLRRLEPQLEWFTLEKALIRSGQYQFVSPGNYAVKFVTAVFQVRNPSAGLAHFICHKPEAEPGRIETVMLDQQAVAYRAEAGGVRLEFDLAANEQRIITIKYHPYPVRRLIPSFSYRFKARLRRRLSEFRDNHLSRSDRVLGLAKSLKRWLVPED